MQALEGIKVIDVSQVAAVPMCARHLADFGAEVIHVENPKTGDSWRSLQAGHGGNAGVPSEIPYNWEHFNRNKRSLAVDLSQEAGQEIIYKLVKDADVFVTNLRLFEQEKFGLDYDTLNRLNSRIIYGSVTGHGKKGPEKNTPAYDTTVYWARSGVTHMLTTMGLSGPNTRPAFGDVVAGLGLAFGISLALRVREKTGRGQEIDLSLLNTGLYQLTFDVAAALATGQDPREWAMTAVLGADDEKTKQRQELMDDVQKAITRLVEFYREQAPNPMATIYQTKDGRQLRFNALNAERYWLKFCRLTSHEELLDDPRFASMESRRENRVELYRIFKESFESKTLDEWKPYLVDIPVSPVQNLVDILRDPQVTANNMFVPVEHPAHGEINVMANPINLSETPATIRTTAPEFSQHTEEVLLELGYSWEDIVRFKEDQLIP